jgi:hypothetical protein
MAKQNTACAHFGADAEKAFQLFAKSIEDVGLAAETLIETVQHEGVSELKEKMRADIWARYASYEGGDKVGRQIDDAVALIKGFCCSVLEWKGE